MVNFQKFDFLQFLTIPSVTTGARELDIAVDSKGEMREIQMMYRQVSRE